MPPSHERRRCSVTSSLIGWAHTQNDSCNLSGITNIPHLTKAMYFNWIKFIKTGHFVRVMYVCSCDNNYMSRLSNWGKLKLIIHFTSGSGKMSIWHWSHKEVSGQCQINVDASALTTRHNTTLCFLITNIGQVISQHGVMHCGELLNPVINLLFDYLWERTKFGYKSIPYVHPISTHCVFSLISYTCTSYIPRQ